jgi:hypothetical protein
MKNAKTLLTIVVIAAIGIVLTGCALLPYDSDYSCGYSSGYDRCLGAKENYKISQMSENERNRYLNRETKSVNNSETSSSYCDRLRESCGCLEGECFDFESLQSLNNNGCLTPSEIIALNNHEALLYIERLLLDRKAVETRTPDDNRKPNANVMIASLTNDYVISSDNGDDNANVKADARLNDYPDGVIDNGETNSSVRANANTIVCGFPKVAKGSTVQIEVDRAWLRSKPDPKYPPDNAIEAKRGDRFIVSEGSQSSNCGWLKLNNGRYIHQSIVSVISQRKADQ